MTSLISRKNNNYTGSPKSLLIGDIPIKETIAKFSPATIVVSNSKFEYTNTTLLIKENFENILTQHCMRISELSLSEDWENEIDDRWNSFLKD